MPVGRLTVLSALVIALVAIFAVATFVLADVTVGDTAPDFELGKVDGNGTIKLSDLMKNGKPTLLVFWVSWCPHCQREMPVLDKVYRDLKANSINAIGVSVDDDLEDAREFVSEYNITFPNVYAGTDAGEKVLDNYGIRGVPNTYIIDKDGVVRAHYVGEVSEKVIKEQFEKLGVK